MRDKHGQRRHRGRRTPATTSCAAWGHAVPILYGMPASFEDLGDAELAGCVVPEGPLMRWSCREGGTDFTTVTDREVDALLGRDAEPGAGGRLRGSG